MFLALIVEDNTAFCANLYSALQSRFPFVGLVIAGGLREALTEVDFARPDLIFVDVHLGDGNGLDLTRRLRASGIDAAIVVLTVHDIPEYRDEALRSGADRFMVKAAMNFDDVFDVVQTLLARRFRALIVARETSFEDRVGSFLRRAEPTAVIARAADVDEALTLAHTLKPNLVVLRTPAGAERERNFCNRLHADQTDTNPVVVSVCDPSHDGIQGVCPADYCLEYSALESEMTPILGSLLHGRQRQPAP